MAKIPFTLEAWLKDKSQKVETREGRIVHDIWEVKNAVTAKEYRTEVCALIEGEEDALVFFKNGKYLPVNAESPYDLFIVTPEPELTEFEQELVGLIGDWNDSTEHFPSEFVKKRSHILLSLAKDQLRKDGYIVEKYNKLFDKCVKNIDDKLLTTMQVEYGCHVLVRNGHRHAELGWEQFQKVAQKFYDMGKAEALKDLPRWKKIDRRNNYSSNAEFSINGRYLEMTDYFNDVYEVALSNLEKLPKED